MNKWSGKVALVTGASVGIGKSIVQKLVQHGMQVVGCARDFEKLQENALECNKNGPGKMFAYQCDLKHEEQIIAMFEFIREKFGTLHVCINNAGLAHRSSLLTGKTEDWRNMFDINVIALCIGIRESVKLMKESGVDDGHVININSMSGHRISGLSIYSGSKFAVTALTEGLRRELIEAKSHIRTTSISPGLVETQFAFRLNNDDERSRKAYSSMKCLQGDDIADAVIFALQSPPHMAVNEIMIRPTEQDT